MGFEASNHFLQQKESGNRKNVLGLLELNDNLLINVDLPFLTKASVKMLVNSFHYVRT